MKRLVLLWAVLLAAVPLPADIAFHKERINLYASRTQFVLRYYNLDIDGDGTPELEFVNSPVSAHVRTKNDVDRLLIRPSPPPNIGGSLYAIREKGFLIGPDAPAGLAWTPRLGTNHWQQLALCVVSGIPGEPACPGNFAYEFLDNKPAYMGLEFQRGGDTRYAWIKLGVTTYPTTEIFEWAWETRPGTAILSGAIPEPSSFALLASGALFLRLFFRKRGAGSTP